MNSRHTCTRYRWQVPRYINFYQLECRTLETLSWRIHHAPNCLLFMQHQIENQILFAKPVWYPCPFRFWSLFLENDWEMTGKWLGNDWESLQYFILIEFIHIAIYQYGLPKHAKTFVLKNHYNAFLAQLLVPFIKKIFCFINKKETVILGMV